MPLLKKQTQIKSTQGFSLIEVLVAISIVGIITVSLFLTFSHGFALSSNIRKKLKALHLATSNLDMAVHLISEDFDFIPGGTIDVQSGNEYKFVYDSDFSSVRVNIEEIAFLGEVNCKVIHSAVEYDSSGIHNTVSFDTAVYWIGTVS